MIEELPISIFWVLFACFGVMLGIALVWRSGVFAFVAGLFLMLMFIPVTSLQTDNILSSNTTGLADSVVWDQQTITGQVPIHNGTSNIVLRGEHLTTSSSQLFGGVVNCMELAIGKTGSPSIGTPVILGVFSTTVSSSIAETKYEFGRINVTNIVSDKRFFEECNEDADYTLVTGDRVGLMYRAGDASNFITYNENTNNPFDGTVTVVSSFNDATNTWTNVNSQDIGQITLSLNGDTSGLVVSNEYEVIEIDWTIKALIVLFGSLICLFGWWLGDFGGMFDSV